MTTRCGYDNADVTSTSEQILNEEGLRWTQKPVRAGRNPLPEAPSEEKDVQGSEAAERNETVE